MQGAHRPEAPPRVRQITSEYVRSLFHSIDSSCLTHYCDYSSMRPELMHEPCRFQ
jgi:hypothetical protein